MSKTVSGSCLCGQVKCSVEGPFQRFFQCHCNRCQKKAGTAFAALLFTTPDKLTWVSGKELVKQYDLPEAERFRNAFCSSCGSQVPYPSRDNSYLVVPAGFLDDDPEIRPMANIFWQERPAWFDEGKQATCFDAYPS
ncbi:GFA family protein [Glaciecola sp. 1036]|uniref:GFA family protein n=1 Tax=Alteromonadaceae TaxID=72275 RepID=UPI003D0192E1